MTSDAIPSRAAKYRTIVADPPWPYKGGGKTPPGYPLMQMEQIKRLPVGRLSTDPAHLYLWTSHRFLRDSWDVAECWGFAPTYLLTWCKSGLGIGRRFRHNCEYVWFCERGWETFPVTRSDLGTWFQWPRGRHSEKPAGFYDLVEQVSPGPYVELFARRQRLGWDTWGDEALDHVGRFEDTLEPECA